MEGQWRAVTWLQNSQICSQPVHLLTAPNTERTAGGSLTAQNAPPKTQHTFSVVPLKSQDGITVDGVRRRKKKTGSCRLASLFNSPLLFFVVVV